ncbi:MAG: tetratricopeptide repeat protein, partial [Magnetococcales bacterium]|nr:tetratricopeptide repeat protein [Magnetococcales bacterium]
EAVYREAIRIQPECAESFANLGALLRDRGRFLQAEDCFLNALRLNPAHVSAYNNYGIMLCELDRLEEAETAYRNAVRIRPGFSDAWSNLALLLLKEGRFEEGWRMHEFRHHPERLERIVVMPDLPFPLWQGEDLTGKALLVLQEQGVGECILYAGMLPEVLHRGAARVVLACDARLVPLFERSFPALEFAGVGVEHLEDLSALPCDWFVLMGSMGRWLRPDRDSFPGLVSYLTADAGKVGRLRNRYRRPEGGLLVGIAWHSANPRFGAKKSTSLMELRPLLELPGCTFVDLQYGDTRAEREAFSRETGIGILHDDAIDQMTDLDSFAAQVAAMDCVVTISNTTAHMAGALGVPTLLLLWRGPLWYWAADREDCLWYPSVRIFRAQAEKGLDMDAIVSYLADLLIVREGRT